MQNDPAVERYADALFETALAHKSLEEVQQDLEQFTAVYEESDQLNRFLRSFRVTAADKVRVFRKVFSEQMNQYVLNTIALMLQHQRAAIIPELRRAFTEKIKTHQNIIDVYAYTAHPMDDDIRAQVKTALENVLEKQVDLIESVDESLQGGIKLRIKNTVYDGTITHQLAKLREQLS